MISCILWLREAGALLRVTKAKVCGVKAGVVATPAAKLAPVTRQFDRLGQICVDSIGRPPNCVADRIGEIGKTGRPHAPSWDTPEHTPEPGEVCQQVTAQYQRDSTTESLRIFSRGDNTSTRLR